MNVRILLPLSSRIDGSPIDAAARGAIVSQIKELTVRTVGSAVFHEVDLGAFVVPPSTVEDKPTGKKPKVAPKLPAGAPVFGPGLAVELFLPPGDHRIALAVRQLAQQLRGLAMQPSVIVFESVGTALTLVH